MSDSSKGQLNDWVNEQLSQLLEIDPIDIELTTVSGDASFRRYFRAQLSEQSFIAVDAPPDTENNKLFVEIADYLREAGVQSPKVFAKNYLDGFLLIEDFGDRLYLPRLLTLQVGGLDAISEYQVDTLYRDAIRSIVRMQ